MLNKFKKILKQQAIFPVLATEKMDFKPEHPQIKVHAIEAMFVAIAPDASANRGYNSEAMARDTATELSHYMGHVYATLKSVLSKQFHTEEYVYRTSN